MIFYFASQLFPFLGELHNKYNILNLIMDEICLIPQQLSCSPHTSELFLKVCHDQHIFITLFEFIGFPAFVSLCATNSQVSKAINKHQEVQVRLLRLKVKKLKDRDFKRRFPNFLRVDLNLFNPFLLPPYQEDVEAEPSINLEELHKQATLVEIRKLHDNDFTRKRIWGKWRANKKAELMLGSKEVIKQKSELKEHQLATKMETMQKMRVIQQADAILQLRKQMKKKIIQQYPATKDMVEDMRNRHFAQKILGQKLTKSPKGSYSNTKTAQVKKQMSQKIQGDPKSDDLVWEVSIKHLMVAESNKLRRRQSEHWIPQKNPLQSGIQSLLETPVLAAKSIKNGLSSFLGVYKN